MKKLILFCFLNLVGLDVNATELRIYTEHYPPYNYETEAGKVTGFSTEIVETLVKRVGVKAKIELYPWARAYDIVLREKNTTIYTITRSKERESLFKWVGPIAARTIYLYKLKNRTDIKVNSMEDAKKYVIGASINDAFGQSLLKMGFENGKNIEFVPSEKHHIRKLFAGRVDLSGNVELAMAHLIKLEGFKYDDVEKVYKFPDKSAYYIGFNKRTSDDLINRFQKALDKIKQDGTFKKIKDKYLK